MRLHERTNARHLAEGAFGERVALVVIDVSFIGLAQLLPAIDGQLAPGGRVVALVKPQFEVAPQDVASGGIVRSPEARAKAVRDVAAAARTAGFSVEGEVESPLRGADGNIEYLLLLRKPEA